MNKKEYDKEYHKTEKYKEYQKKYALTKKRKTSLKKYRQSKRGKDVAQKSVRKYRDSEKGKAAITAYLISEKGKAVACRAQKKYHQSEKGKRTTRIRDAGYRGLGYNEICENPYPRDVNVAYHHINDVDVVPVPTKIHSKFSGNNITLNIHRKLISDWIKENYLIKIDGVIL